MIVIFHLILIGQINAHHFKQKDGGGGDCISLIQDAQMPQGCFENNPIINVTFVVELTLEEEKQLQNAHIIQIDDINTSVEIEQIPNSYSWNFLHDPTYKYEINVDIPINIECSSPISFQNGLLYFKNYLSIGDGYYDCYKFYFKYNLSICCDCDNSDLDSDGDGFPDLCDLCPNYFDIFQSDLDNDSLGDNCDDDIDGDGLTNDIDLCPFLFAENRRHNDYDNDGIGDECDNCPLIYNPLQEDLNGNEIGDECEIQRSSKDIQETNLVNIFPNPTTEIINVVYIHQKIELIRIYNLNGNLLITIKANSNQTQIDVSQLYPGIYILTCKLGSQEITNSKFIIN